MILRITKEFKFEMAHALHNYRGKCAHIHGHSYHLEVTIKGKPIDDSSNPQNGMVLDFGLLKSIVHEEILSIFDHALVLKDTDPLAGMINNGSYNLVITPFQPTCENLVIDFVERLQKRITPPVTLHSLKLRETATSYATWNADDVKP